MAWPKKVSCAICGDKLRVAYFKFRQQTICNICRRPKGLREILRAGVPFTTADGLYRLLKGARRNGKVSAEFTLSIVHPILMANISVRGTGFKIKNDSFVWIRRRGWEKKGA